jgi:hypothetical protein
MDRRAQTDCGEREEIHLGERKANAKILVWKLLCSLSVS